MYPHDAWVHLTLAPTSPQSDAQTPRDMQSTGAAAIPGNRNMLVNVHTEPKPTSTVTRHMVQTAVHLLLSCLLSLKSARRSGHRSNSSICDPLPPNKDLIKPAAQLLVPPINQRRNLGNISLSFRIYSRTIRSGTQEIRGNRGHFAKLKHSSPP